MWRGQRKITLVIGIFSIILLSGSFSFHDASAETANIPIELKLMEPMGSAIFQEWDVFPDDGTTALEAVTDGLGDLDAKYVESMVNDEIQGFEGTPGLFGGNVGSINYIEISSIGRNFDDQGKPTKYSIGVARETDTHPHPNGGARVGIDWEVDPVRMVRFETDPSTSSNQKAQTPWDKDVLNNMAYDNGDRLLFVIAQNTAAKNIAVTEFWVSVNVNLISITMEDLDPASDEWGEEVTVSGTYSGIVEPTNSIMVDFGDGVLVQATVNDDGTWSATLVGGYDKEFVGLNTITAYIVDTNDIPLDEFEFPSQEFDVLKRPTVLTLNQNMPNNELWGFSPATALGTLTDQGTGVGVEGETVYLFGPGLGSIEDELITDSDGVFSDTGSSASFGGAVTLSAIHEESDYYLAGGSGNDNYTTEPHPTSLSINHIDDVIAGHNIYPVGELLSAGEPVVGKQITFTSNSPEGDSITIGDTTTLGAVTITGPNGLTVDAGNLLRLNEGDSINAVNQHFLDIVLEEADRVQVRVFGLDGSQSIEDNCIRGECFTGPFTLFHPAIIDRVEIKTITGTTDIGVSSMATKIVPEATVASTEFTPGTEPFYQFGAGAYSSSGQTPLNDAAGFGITACFVSDSDYLGDCIDSNAFDTAYQTLVGSGSSNSGTLTNSLDDSGKGIVSVACITDSDIDGICDEWYASGIPFMVGNTQYYYPITGASAATKDLFVEIDAMSPHADDSVAISDVVTAMANHGVTLRHESTIGAITHVDTINVWRDTDTDSTNDFNSIKTNNYGNSDEIIKVTGTPTFVVNNEKLIQSFDGNMDDDSGNSNAGSFLPSGSPNYVTGQIGQAIHLDGSTERVKFPDNTFNSEDRGTVTAWINPDTVHTGIIFGAADSDSANGLWSFGLKSDGGIAKLSVFTRTNPPESGGNRLQVSTAIPLNTWTHVAVTGTGDIADPWNLYINGVKQIGGVLEVTNDNHARWWDSQLLGGSGNLIYTAGSWERSTNTLNYFDGKIDDLRVYDFVLTDDQIENMYNVGAIGAPTSYYDFNDNVEDDTNNVDGITSGTTDYVSGKIGKAIDFIGTNYVDLGDDSFSSQTQGTVAAWINPDTVHTGIIFGVADSNSQNGLWYLGVRSVSGDTKLTMFTRDNPNTNGGNKVNSLATIPLNSWTHVAVTGTGDIADPWILYINGVPQSVNVQAGGNLAQWWDDQLIGSGVLRYDIGVAEKKNGNANYFNGQIDEVRVYDTPLNQSEIAKLMDTTTDKVNSLIEISGLSIDTPNTVLTGGDTDATISIDLDVTTSGPTTINEDENRSGTVIGTPDAGYAFDEPSVSSTGNTGDKLLEIRVPFTTTAEVDGSAGTIQVPVISEVPITAATMDKTATVSSTLLDAKAHAYRYVLFVHNISGGSSGAAEMRGNDAVIGLGTGYGESNAGHAGSEGNTDELAGTYLHELGHLLNMDHGGPRYLLSDPLTTLGTSTQNCNPVQKSVMTYTGQMPNYSTGSGGSYTTNWELKFNTEVAVLDETNIVEADGYTLSGSPTIVWATPGGATGWLLGIADGSALNWNGDNNSIDSASSGNPFDVNFFDIAGCEESPGETLIAFNEPAEFDFNFRSGNYGTFDGLYPQQVSDLNSKMHQEQQLSGADFRITPPPPTDGTGIIEPGDSVLLQFEYFKVENFGGTQVETLIPDATIRADLVFDDGTIIKGDEVGGLGEFAWNSGTQKYELLWQTNEDDNGPTGIIFTVVIDNVTDDQVEDKERILIVDENETPLAMAGPDGELTDFNDPSWPGDDVLVTVKITLQSLIDRAIELLEENNSQSAKEAIRNLNAAIREFAKDNDIKGIQKVGNGIQNVKEGGDSGDIPSELETEVQELLMDFLRNMADDAINDAIAQSGDAALIAEAQDFLATADEKRAMQDYESAHTFYKNAFVSAQEALP